METLPPCLETLPEGERTYFLSPVLRHFHNRPYHVQIAVVRLDKAAILKRYAAKLLRSQAHNRWEDEPPSVSQTQLLFRLSENVFVHLEEEGMWVYAACPSVAAQVLSTWKARFAMPVKDEPPTYYLLGSGAKECSASRSQ